MTTPRSYKVESTQDGKNWEVAKDWINSPDQMNFL